jgi:hypothetical protein
MRKLGRILLRIIFWSYERGSWPYDVMVVAIILFVLLTPRSWFHDQPQIGTPPSAAQVKLVGENLSTSVRVYRVDAGLLAPPKRTPELEQETHQILRRSVPELKGRTFEIVQIEPVRGVDGEVLGYDVSVKPVR